MTLDKLVKISGPQVSHLLNETTDKTFLVGFVKMKQDNAFTVLRKITGTSGYSNASNLLRIIPQPDISWESPLSV